MDKRRSRLRRRSIVPRRSGYSCNAAPTSILRAEFKSRRNPQTADKAMVNLRRRPTLKAPRELRLRRPRPLRPAMAAVAAVAVNAEPAVVSAEPAVNVQAGHKLRERP